MQNRIHHYLKLEIPACKEGQRIKLQERIFLPNVSFYEEDGLKHSFKLSDKNYQNFQEYRS